MFYIKLFLDVSQKTKDTLDNIISETQSGFLKVRYIGENTLFIYDILSEMHNIPGLLVLTDFEKEFESYL